MPPKHYVDNKKLFEVLVRYRKSVDSAKKRKRTPPPIPEYVGECLLMIAQRLSNKPNFASYCVDEQTEALTQRGWLRHDQITPDDIILSMDIHDRQLKWSPIHEIYRGKSPGACFHLTTHGLDALVTAGHKFVVGQTLRAVEDLRSKDSITIMGTPETSSSEMVFSDAFVELVGWYVTEGTRATYQKVNGTVSSYIALCQNEGRKSDRIRSCLESYGHERPNNKKLKSFYVSVNFANQLNIVAPNKVPTISFINSLTSSQRLLLIDTMIAGDGWVTRSGHRRYCQKDANQIDSFSYLCALAGIATRSRYREWQSGFGLAKMWLVTLYDKNHVYCEKIDFHGANRGKSQTTGVHEPRQGNVSYDGPVWCPRTDYGTFVCRRNGYVYVTGNTFRDDMVADAIENSIMYMHNFDPLKSQNPFAYFTQITHYAFIRRIEREKKYVYTKYKYALHKAYQKEDHVTTPGETSTIRDPAWTHYENIHEFIQGFEEKLARPKIARMVDGDEDDDIVPFDVLDETDETEEVDAELETDEELAETDEDTEV